jgi:geranylgeranyl diphosphate synthase type I
MGDVRVEKVLAFIKGLFPQVEGCSNIVDTSDSAFSLDEKESIFHLLLPILCSEAEGGDENQATMVAAAWFLLYLAAKVLDDIEDGDFHRAPWSTIGAPQAINAATGLIFASQLALTHLPKMGARRELTLLLIEDFNCTTLRMCSGQHADLTEEDGFTLERYFQIAGAKSGEFFSLACRAGALLGTDEVAPYSDFGYNLGVLIQICDDFEGIWNPKGRSDLAAGKRTLPILYALTVAPQSIKERLEQLLVKAIREGEAEEEARRIITELGAPHYLLIEAQIRRQRAESALCSAGSSSPAYSKLINLLDEHFKMSDDAIEIPFQDAIEDKNLALLGSLLSPLDHLGPAGGSFPIRLDSTLRWPGRLSHHF